MLRELPHDPKSSKLGYKYSSSLIIAKHGKQFKYLWIDEQTDKM